MVQCDFASIRERDMDVLFAETFAADPAFLPYVLEKAGLPSAGMQVVKVELSRQDEDGESDITVTISDGAKRIGLLIEDKISAPAQPRQLERYEIRGQKQVGQDFDEFIILIFCPDKYRESNGEAKKYPYHVSYEFVRDYYVKLTDPLSRLRCQQIEQAIEQAAKTSQVILNEKAISFFNQYHKFVDKEFHDLKMRTKTTSNGYWQRFGTKLGGSYIMHKTNKAVVDFTFLNATRSDLENIQKLLSRIGINNVEVVSFDRTVALSIKVPEIKYTEDYSAQESNLRECLDAVQTFSDLAELMSYGKRLTER